MCSHRGKLCLKAFQPYSFRCKPQRETYLEEAGGLSSSRVIINHSVTAAAVTRCNADSLLG